MKRLALTLIAGCIATACTHLPEMATQKCGIPVAELVAEVETTPVPSMDDAADDPAIWINDALLEESRVLGTDKQHGLMVYDLQGNELQSLALGRINNVDVRKKIQLHNRSYDLAMASNRSSNTLDVFEIDTAGNVSLLAQQALSFEEPYGMCMHRDSDGQAHVFVNDKNGRYQHWQLHSVTPFAMALVREFRVSSQPEGCAVDDQSETLFVGEENLGLWRFSAAPDAATDGVLLDRVGTGALVADVEGMDIYRRDDKTAYLVVSSQGDFSFIVYQFNATDFRYRGAFRIIDNIDKAIDGVEETDGLAVSAQNLGAPFENGMLVVQDGFNRQPEAAQNFKYISWDAISKALQLKDRLMDSDR